jgi:hypothetical protein
MVRISEQHTMRLISLMPWPSEVAWKPLLNMEDMMRSRLLPSLKSYPRMTGVPSGTLPDALSTA